VKKQLEDNTESSKQWYYKQEDGRHEFVRGPFTRQEILEKLEKGIINKNTLIRHSSSYWYPAFRYLSNTPIYQKISVKFVILFLITISITLLIIKVYRVSRSAPVSYNIPVTEKAIPGPPEKQSYDKNVTGLHHPLQEVLTKEDIIRLTNYARIQSGLPQLTENQLLNVIAEERVRDMLEKQYLGHVSPTGEQASDIAQKVGYRYKIIAENIASGMFMNNQKIINGWLQSPGHRKNMFSQDIKEIGVAILKGTIQGQETWVAIQIFGLPSLPVAPQACIPPPQELKNEIEAKSMEIRNINSVLSDLKQKLDTEKESIEADKRRPSNNKQAINNLRIKIKIYNEKSNVYNNFLADVNAKSIVLRDMVTKYNTMLQDYNECRGSNK
jgi:uncharacterized protein YkwD